MPMSECRANAAFRQGKLEGSQPEEYVRSELITQVLLKYGYGIRLLFWTPKIGRNGGVFSRSSSHFGKGIRPEPCRAFVSGSTASYSILNYVVQRMGL